MKVASTTKQKTEKQSELLHTQLNADEQENSFNYGNRLINVKQVEGTPFKIVTKADEEEGKNSFIAIGQNRLTELQSYGKCKMIIQERSWELIMQMIVYIVDKVVNEMEKNNERQSEII